VRLHDGEGKTIKFRRESFKRLLNNDSLKYHEKGMEEVFEEFRHY
jgi:hypothetical protein